MNRSASIKKISFYGFQGSLNESAWSSFAENRHLKSLNLSTGSVSDFGVKLIAKSVSLVNLDLANNAGVTDGSAFALSQSSSIKFLDLDLCNVGFEGCKALILNKSFEKLSLCFNKISAEECILLKELALKESPNLKLEISENIDHRKAFGYK